MGNHAGLPPRTDLPFGYHSWIDELRLLLGQARSDELSIGQGVCFEQIGWMYSSRYSTMVTMIVEAVDVGNRASTYID